MIEENVKKLISGLPEKNPYGETITLVAATKTQTVEDVNLAISAGITDIGENRAQEFRDKFPLVLPCRYHFFGRLQKNKIKYLIGKACLIQSVDSLELAQAISQASVERGCETNILLEVNQGEEQKGGIPFESVVTVYESVLKLPSVKIQGLMTVLPESNDIISLEEKCLQTRALYDIIRKSDENFRYLSMGMSGDYQTAIKCGSNMIRIGTAIFGKRQTT